MCVCVSKYYIYNIYYTRTPRVVGGYREENLIINNIIYVKYMIYIIYKRTPRVIWEYREEDVIYVIYMIFIIYTRTPRVRGC